MKIKIKEWCFSIASLGSIGYLPFGAQIAAMITFPILVLLGWLSFLSTSFFYSLVTLLALFLVVVVFVALRFETDQHSDVIVINNVLGILVTFMFVPITVKFAIIGFVFFYGAKYLVPKVMRTLIGPSFDQWPLFATLLGVDVAAGVVVNIFLRFVWWMAN